MITQWSNILNNTSNPKLALYSIDIDKLSNNELKLRYTPECSVDSNKITLLKKSGKHSNRLKQ